MRRTVIFDPNDPGAGEPKAGCWLRLTWEQAEVLHTILATHERYDDQEDEVIAAVVGKLLPLLLEHLGAGP